MASPIDICNEALADIGARSTINSFDEGSNEAINCGIWYNTLRKSLLRAAPWGFARAQASLSMLGSADAGTSVYPWPYKYSYPADALRIRYILPPTPPLGQQPLQGLWQPCAPSRNNRFIIGNELDEFNEQRRIVLATLQSAQAVYIRDVSNVDLMDEQFKLALAAMLSYKLVIPLAGNVQMRADFRATADQMVVSARASDGNEADPTTDHTPDWIQARGINDLAPNIPTWGLGSWLVGWDDLNWGA